MVLGMAAKREETKNERSLLYVFAYLFEWLSGIIVYFIAKDNNPRLKKHAIQAILLGITSIVIAFIFSLLLVPIVSAIVNILIWFYGIFAGIRAYYGVDVKIPGITPYAERHASYQTLPPAKRKQAKVTSQEEDAVAALKMRYVQGKITKKKYEQMKKDLEK